MAGRATGAAAALLAVLALGHGAAPAGAPDDGAPPSLGGRVVGLVAVATVPDFPCPAVSHQIVGARVRTTLWAFEKNLMPTDDCGDTLLAVPLPYRGRGDEGGLFATLLFPCCEMLHIGPLQRVPGDPSAFTASFRLCSLHHCDQGSIAGRVLTAPAP